MASRDSTVKEFVKSSPDLPTTPFHASPRQRRSRSAPKLPNNWVNSGDGEGKEVSEEEESAVSSVSAISTSNVEGDKKKKGKKEKKKRREKKGKKKGEQGEKKEKGIGEEKKKKKWSKAVTKRPRSFSTSLRSKMGLKRRKAKKSKRMSNSTSDVLPLIASEQSVEEVSHSKMKTSASMPERPDIIEKPDLNSIDEVKRQKEEREEEEEESESNTPFFFFFLIPRDLFLTVFFIETRRKSKSLPGTMKKKLVGAFQKDRAASCDK